MVVIRGTRRGGLYEMISTVKSASTVISTNTLTWRVVGGDDMTGCNGAVTVETCHMAVSVIAQLSGQKSSWRWQAWSFGVSWTSWDR
jgi:hypothetical protein